MQRGEYSRVLGPGWGLGEGDEAFYDGGAGLIEWPDNGTSTPEPPRCPNPRTLANGCRTAGTIGVQSKAGILLRENLMDELNRHRSFAHRRRHTLHTSGAYIAYRENAGETRFE